MPVVRPTFVGMHDKPASHWFAPTEMTQFAPLGAASAESSEDNARNAAQLNKGKRKSFLISSFQRERSDFSDLFTQPVE